MNTRVALPDPRPVLWPLRSVESARIDMSVLSDGRRRIVIEHATLRGVTPAMPAWWFAHVEGDVDYAGRRWPRYLVWHPLDHISYEVVGPGARLHIREAFQRDPRNLLDVIVTVERIDTDAAVIGNGVLGYSALRLVNRFESNETGTRYVTEMMIGSASWLGRHGLNRLPRSHILRREQARAWARHQIEEGRKSRELPAGAPCRRRADPCATVTICHRPTSPFSTADSNEPDDRGRKIASIRQIPLNEEQRMSTTTHPQPITGGPKHVNREKTGGILRQTRLSNEPSDYLQKREELRLAEMEMFRNIERVAALRRTLPVGAEVTDYVFQEGPRDLSPSDSPVSAVRLSDLFSGAGRSLIIYHFMYGKRNTAACPMCTMWIDTFNGIAPHLAQNADLAIVAAADPAALRAHARTRGWHNLRLLSAGDSTFKYDFRSEDAEGQQDSALSVFTRDAAGTLRHFYTAHPWLDEDMNERGIDLLQPVYNMLDLTPQGRGKWYASLDYGTRVNWAPHAG